MLRVIKGSMITLIHLKCMYLEKHVKCQVNAKCQAFLKMFIAAVCNLPRVSLEHLSETPPTGSTEESHRCDRLMEHVVYIITQQCSAEF